MIDRYRKSFEALKELEKIDLMTEDSYQEIFRIIREKIIIPFVTLTIPVGQVLYRARLNEICSFKSKTDISYNKNLEKIEIAEQTIFINQHFMLLIWKRLQYLKLLNHLKIEKLEQMRLLLLGNGL